MAPDEGSLRGVTPEDVYGALGLKQDLRVLAQGQPHVLASIGNSVVIGERDTTGGWGSRAFKRVPYVKSHTATAEIHFPEDRTSLDSYLVGAHALLGRRMEGDLYMLSISPDAPRKHVDRGGVRVATEIKYGLKALFGTNDGAGYVTGKVGFSNSDGLRVNQLDGDVDFERGLRAYFGDFQRNTVDFDAGDFASRFEGTDIGVEHLAMEDGSPLDLVAQDPLDVAPNPNEALVIEPGFFDGQMEPMVQQELAPGAGPVPQEEVQIAGWGKTIRGVLDARKILKEHKATKPTEEFKRSTPRKRSLTEANALDPDSAKVIETPEGQTAAVVRSESASHPTILGYLHR